MFKAQLVALMLSLRALLIPCGPGQESYPKSSYAVAHYARLPKQLQESSGLEHAGGGTFWTQVDGGGAAALYRIAADGRLLETLPLPLRNQDWEELARDSAGHVYIGDFGNNLNQRQNLRIYKVHPQTQQIDTIQFRWADQQAFPPPKQEMNYDCEAFFWYKGSLHLFTKARGNRQVQHYRLPDQAGTYVAQVVESTKVNDLVTAADISPDGSTLALLTYGKVYLFRVSAPGSMLQHPLGCIRIPWAGQSESLLFVNNSSLLIGNETGRLIYLML